MKLDFISARGDRLPLADNDLFFLTNMSGQTSATAALSSSIVGGMDGDVINNAQANPRTIVFDLRIRSGVNVEDAKRAILKVIKLKQQGSLEWTQNNRSVLISGIVESIDMPRWSEACMMQVTLHCEQPFWEDADNIVKQISEAIDLHWFTDSMGGMLYFVEDGMPLGEYDTIRTKDFYNDGDVAVGMEISIVAFDTVTNPIIYDNQGNFFGVGHGSGSYEVTMQPGDNIIVSTHRGSKRVTLNGVSLLSKLHPQSSWLQMQTGDNRFTINSDDDSLTNMTFSLIYKQRYI